MAGLKLGRGSPDAQIARPAVVLDRLGRWGYSCREVSQIAGRDVAQSAFGMLPQSQPGALRSY